ncbi:glycosyltransferase [Aldersonia sp. NBC_00410]|uniref:glycosyltransferase n=1 Tax=Aldersonia sp. NBC_00410 TaxID=2975954 RepID=UPI0022502A55|nr:glycosyltransferase [Aldersonia sp. NBC_00410]MCX5041677.1 glycosyltransferase [Aldersonia sp. NBC_00410]
MQQMSGSVIVPAHNESAVIAQTLAPLSDTARTGLLEVLVVCNGCTDDTAAVARSVPGIEVLEIAEASKVAALNAGDDVATRWPRLYLDADIRITPQAVAEVFDVLRSGEVLAARPASRYDTTGASRPVRSYYRARARIPQFGDALWGAGAYGLNEAGHVRIGRFPAVTGDDLWVDQQFNRTEKAVVPTEPTLVATPRDSRSLIRTLRRVYQGTNDQPGGSSSGRSLKTVLTSVRGPRSAIDTSVYVAFALAGRRRGRTQVRWERDESSRSG